MQKEYDADMASVLHHLGMCIDKQTDSESGKQFQFIIFRKFTLNFRPIFAQLVRLVRRRVVLRLKSTCVWLWQFVKRLADLIMVL
jgi:hypothetical protein